jgi:hypothetical protein
MVLDFPIDWPIDAESDDGFDMLMFVFVSTSAIASKTGG